MQEQEIILGYRELFEKQKKLLELIEEYYVKTWSEKKEDRIVSKIRRLEQDIMLESNRLLMMQNGTVGRKKQTSKRPIKTKEKEGRKIC